MKDFNLWSYSQLLTRRVNEQEVNYIITVISIIIIAAVVYDDYDYDVGSNYMSR
jgi:hypothetical protein